MISLEKIVIYLKELLTREISIKWPIRISTKQASKK